MSDWIQVSALVDGELAPEETSQVQKHVQTPVGAAEYRAVREVKMVIASKCVQPGCEEQWKKCARRLDEIDRTKRVESFVGRYAWGLCSVLVVAIVGAAMLNRSGGNSLRTDDVARAASSFIPVTAPRSQAPDVKRKWLEDMLDKTMPVRPEQISVTGGATGALADGRKIACVNLRDSQGPLKLIVVESADKLDDVQRVEGHSQYCAGHIGDANCIGWTDRGSAYFLVADRPLSALCQAADAVYSPAQ